jgi:hypothetical protein
VEDVVQAAVLIDPFYGGDVAGFRDDADHGSVAAVVGADLAHLVLTDVLADLAEPQQFPGRPQGVGEPPDVVLGHPQDVVGEALG